MRAVAGWIPFNLRYLVLVLETTTPHAEVPRMVKKKTSSVEILGST